MPSFRPSEPAGGIAERLRALAGGSDDADTLRRGLQMLAGEVEACEEALHQTTKQVAALAGRMAAMEAGAQSMTRAAGGVESIGREVFWLAGEMKARQRSIDDLSRRMDDVGRELASVRDQTGEQTSAEDRPAADRGQSVRRELDRLAGEVSGTPDFLELARAALRSVLLEGSVGELREELAKVAGQLAAGQQAAMAHVAGGDAPLEGALHEMRRELDRVVEETAAANEAVRSETQRMVAGVEDRLRGMESLPSDIEGSYRELDRLSNQVSRLAERTESQTELASRLGDRIDALALALEADDREAALESRMSEVADRVVEVDGRLSEVGERLAAFDERVAALLALASDVEGLYRELDRVAELTLSRDGALAQLTDRTSPLETAVGELRHQLDRLAGEVAASQQAAVAELSERVDSMAGRYGAVEELAQQVAALGAEVGRVAEEAGSAQQAALAAATEQLGLAGRLRDLEALTQDIEGLYRDFERVAEIATARSDRQQELVDRLAELEAAVSEARREIEVVSGQGQSTELDLRRRLAALESLTGELESIYRELGRVAALASDHEERSVGLEAIVAGMRDGLAELRERIEDERVYTTEQVSGLWARMRAIESVPGEMERVSEQLERLAEAARSAHEDASEKLAALARRVQALEVLPADVQSLYGELDRLAEQSREHDERVAAVRQGLEPLESTLADLRRELDSVVAAADAAAVGRLKDLDDRLRQLESLPRAVEEALVDLSRTSSEVVSSHQASLASASVLLEEFNDRLKALESLPADMEGLYAALYRVAESVKALREEART